MKAFQDLASLITIRNFLLSAPENVRFKLSREESNAVSARVAEFDKKIIAEALALNLDGLGKTQVVSHLFSRESTEDTEVVAKKFMQNPGAGTSATLATAPASQLAEVQNVEVKGVQIPTQEVTSHNKQRHARVAKPAFKRANSDE